MQFDDADSLQEHVRQHLNAAFPMRCPLVKPPEDGVAQPMEQCQWVSPTQDDLTQHIMLKHYKLLNSCSACESKEEDHVCKMTPEMLLNEQIMVRWTCDDVGKWFTGVVTDYDPEEGTHLVEYEDE